MRQPIEMPAQLNPLPPGIEEGEIPSSEQLGVKGTCKTKRLFINEFQCSSLLSLLKSNIDLNKRVFLGK